MRFAVMLFVLLTLTGIQSAAASTLGAVLTGPLGGSLLFAVAVIALGLFAALARQASVFLSESTHASRVARVMDTLANQADGIAGMLTAHPPAAGATLEAVREAAIAQSVSYVNLHMPEVLQQIGANDGVLATRIRNFVSDATLAATASKVAPAIMVDIGGMLAGVPPSTATPAA